MFIIFVFVEGVVTCVIFHNTYYRHGQNRSIKKSHWRRTGDILQFMTDFTYFQKISVGLRSLPVELLPVVPLPQRPALAMASQDQGRGLWKELPR